MKSTPSPTPQSSFTLTGESRRQFLKRTGRAAAASALAGVVLPQVHARADSTIKLALIGCGGRGSGAVADTFQTTGGPVKLHAMADLFENRITDSHRRLSEEFPDRVDVPRDRRFVGMDAYQHAMNSLNPGDLVLLATHANFRPSQFEYAVAKGLHVFAEKSFAVDGPSTRRWLHTAEASERKNLKMACGLMWRHSKARQEVIRRIHDGDIGEVHTLRIYRVHGPVHCPPLPAEANEVVFQLQHPNSFTWVSSGFFVDWHCHNVDVACWAKGAWPVSAQGMGGRCHPQAGNQLDHYTVEYTFPDGTKLFAFARHMSGCWETYSDYAHGTKGSAVIMASLGDPRPRIYRGHTMERSTLAWEYGRGDNNPYVEEMQLLLDAIRNDTPHNEARRAGEANLAALLGRAAVHTGQHITWDQMLHSDFRFVQDIDSLTFDSPAPIQAGPDGIYAPPLPGATQEV
jgi:predicted dehydrogenase